MGLSPAEQLSAFENGAFRLEARLQGLGEKGIARLRADLAQLEADASDGVRKAVHHYYTHYIKASQVPRPSFLLGTPPWFTRPTLPNFWEKLFFFW